MHVGDFYDSSWPLGWVEGDGSVGFGNVSGGGFQAWGESRNEVVDDREFSPGGGEIFGSYVLVDGKVRENWGGVDREREILYDTKFSRATLFRYDGKGGRLEGS